MDELLEMKDHKIKLKIKLKIKPYIGVSEWQKSEKVLEELKVLLSEEKTYIS
jgi:hypothetical protein